MSTTAARHLIEHTHLFRYAYKPEAHAARPGVPETPSKANQKRLKKAAADRASLSSSERASYSPLPRLDHTTAYEASLSDSAFEEHVWGLIGPPMGGERPRYMEPTVHITGLMKSSKEDSEINKRLPGEILGRFTKILADVKDEEIEAGTMSHRLEGMTEVETVVPTSAEAIIQHMIRVDGLEEHKLGTEKQFRRPCKGMPRSVAWAQKIDFSSSA